IPEAVVGGTAMVVFAIIGTIGIDMLRKADLHERSNMFVLAGALAMGLLPILVPGFYSGFPKALQPVLGNGLAMGALTAILLNILFHHLGGARGNNAVAGAPQGTPNAH
ncbi:MAG: uracil-xanthine permease, partial [Proteobacteria bacterium]|nr:uracil-xanthine permease [Pseudomonadota bacterium]